MENLLHIHTGTDRLLDGLNDHVLVHRSHIDYALKVIKTLEQNIIALQQPKQHTPELNKPKAKRDKWKVKIST